MKVVAGASVRHGLYADPRYLQPGQVEILEAARGQRGTLLAELDDTRMRRAWLAKIIHEIETGAESGFEDDTQETERDGATVPVDGNGQPIPNAQPVGGTLKTKRVQKWTARKDWYGLLDRYTARIVELERALFDLGKGDPIGDPEQKAQVLKGLFEQALAASGVLPGVDLSQARIIRGPDLAAPKALPEGGG